MSTRTRQGAILSFRVHPAVKSAWDKLDQKTKNMLIRKFQMEILGLSNTEVPEEVKLYLRIEYDENTMRWLKEILAATDEEIKKKEETIRKLKEEYEEKFRALKEWERSVKSFLKRFIDAYSTALCEYGGLASYKEKAKELLESAP